MPPAAPAYLISRGLDPLFALFIGTSAAAMRISREEKQMGRSTQETIDAGLRRLGWKSRNEEKKDVLGR